MRRRFLVTMLGAVLATACGSYNVGDQPAGGAGAPAAPAATAKATPAAAPSGTATPTGNPDVDYGY